MEKVPRVVVGGVIRQGDKVLLIKEMLENRGEMWIIPGGKVEFGETLEDAVKREMREELGVDISIGKMIDFLEKINLKYDYHTVIFFFDAQTDGKVSPSDEKVLDAKFFGKDEMKDLEIVDSARFILGKIGMLD